MEGGAPHFPQGKEISSWFNGLPTEYRNTITNALKKGSRLEKALSRRSGAPYDLVLPNGRRVTIHQTPSDGFRGARNLELRIKRLGLDIRTASPVEPAKIRNDDTGEMTVVTVPPPQEETPAKKTRARINPSGSLRDYIASYLYTHPEGARANDLEDSIGLVRNRTSSTLSWGMTNGWFTRTGRRGNYTYRLNYDFPEIPEEIIPLFSPTPEQEAQEIVAIENSIRPWWAKPRVLNALSNAFLSLATALEELAKDE